MCSLLITINGYETEHPNKRLKDSKTNKTTADQASSSVNKLENTKYVCLTNVKSASLCKMERAVLQHMTNGKVWEGCG